MTSDLAPENIRSVVFLLDRWVPGGVKKHLRDLCRIFDDRGIHCTIAAWLPDGTEETDVPATFLKLPLFGSSNAKSLSGLQRSASIMHEFLSSHRIQILHVHARYMTPVAAMAVRNTETKRVFTAHNVFGNLRYLPWYPRQVICLNQAGKEDFLRNWLLPRHLEVSLIPNGIDPDVTDAPRREPAGPCIFAFVGRLDPWKGVDLILHALAQISEFDVQLEVAGSGPDEESLRSLAARLGVGDKVRFLGHVDNPADVIDRSAALILPSRSFEGFGYVILEAYARRRPVIASDLPVFDDTVRDGHSGLRFECGKRDSLVFAMRQVISQPARMRDMGENGYAILKARFTLDSMVKATLGVYKRALEQ